VARFLAVRDSLNELAGGLRLDDEELPGYFDSGLPAVAQTLAERVGTAFSEGLHDQAQALAVTTQALLDKPAPESMMRVLEDLSQLVLEMQDELDEMPPIGELRLARLYAGVAEQMEGPKPAENQSFHELPRMLHESPWLQRELERLAGAAHLRLAKTPAGRALSPTVAKRWNKRLARHAEVQLALQLDHLRQSLEYRARQVWYLLRSGGEDRSLPVVYCWAHSDLFPKLSVPRSEYEFGLEVAKLKGLALGLQLPDLGLCFDSAEWMAQYALNYLIPPAPDFAPVREPEDLGHLLNCRLSRWYFCHFEHHLEPLEVCAGVLRVGRPLFYERVAAHALLEYSLLQGLSITRQSAPLYVDAMAMLEQEFVSLFDGYLLRLLHYPRLKTPRGWCDYLAALYDLHFGAGSNEELDAFRQLFLARRGLRSTLEVLYRTVESHGAVN